MKVFTLAIVLFCTVSVFAQYDYQAQQAFTAWMHKHKLTFHHDEFNYRFSIWQKNLEWIKKHNTEGHSYTVEMNEYGHLTSHEFRNQYNGFNMQREDLLQFSSGENLFTHNNQDLPASFDWREKGAVTPVKDQAQCGSCWSFSTTGSFEGCHFIKTGDLVSFSEQNLVDCSGSYGNEGCNGGLMTNAMDYIIKNQGLDTEESYPYTGSDGSCKYDSKNSGGTLSGYKNIPSGDEDSLQQAVSVGPVSVAIDAGHMSFQFYKSGVYTSATCSSKNLDHGVLAVGWGTDNSTNQDYWIVKNSWGTGWGQEGYIWMARNANNMCGIATMATIPTC
jgi:cathepsin L